MKTIIDNYQEHQFRDKFLKDCSTCFSENLRMKPSCELCNDEGFITKTEWTGTDDSHDIFIRCECQLD